MTTRDSGAPSHTAAVIPAYNEEGTIADIARRTLPHVDEVIVVDDGSTDGTADALADLDVRVIPLDGNGGKGAALMRGVESARLRGADFIVSLDADGQHPPERIPELLRAARDDTIVFGSRAADAAGIPVARLRANRTANFFISWASGCWIEDSQCGLRVYPARLFDRIRLRRERRSGFVFESEVLIEACRAGWKVAPVAIPALYKQVLQRPSHFRPFFDISAIVVMVTLKILARGFYLQGLWRSQAQRRRFLRERSCIRKGDAAL